MRNKPCPFCGYTKQELRECAGYVLVACRRCGATAQMCTSPGEAIAVWNERSSNERNRKNMRDAIILDDRWPVCYRVIRVNLPCDS